MKPLKVIIHQTHHTIGDFKNIGTYLKNISHPSNDLKDPSADDLTILHLFPELFLTGYPLQDLCLQKPFITQYQKLINEINIYFKSLPSNPNEFFLMGGLNYQQTAKEQKEFLSIRNSILLARKGEGISFIYNKMLLPSYDIFDEAKYFQAGSEANILNIHGHLIALQICEDMWSSPSYEIDPISLIKKEIDKQNAPLSLVVNLSAGPFSLGKDELRQKRAKEISQYLKAPFVYVNRVGGEDEILFDGSSFFVNGQKTLLKLKRFHSDIQEIIVPPLTSSSENHFLMSDYETRSFSLPRWNQNSPYKLAPLDDHSCQEILEALIFGFQEYAQKCSFHSFVVALSGGIDSSLVLAILKLALKEGQKLEAIFMPSKYSSPLSYDLSQELTQNLGIPLHYLPIKFLHASAKNLFKETFGFELQSTADENIQSRIRGMLLYAYSNAKNQMVVNTSNKSEIAVGYSTLYGDSVGAIGLLGDLYKTEIYQLANFINRHHNAIIPKEIISRPPSAELRENQQDQDSLPPYEQLDVVLEGILSYRMDKKDLVDLGFDEKIITKIMKLINLSEYKRKQFCPIIKVMGKSFGFGYRVPITKAHHQ